MKQLKKLKLNDFVEMTDKEMKFIVGGSGGESGSGSGSESSGTLTDKEKCDTLSSCGDSSNGTNYCGGKKCGDSCSANGRNGTCKAFPNGRGYYCKQCILYSH
ncbi:TIGR04149 family rSAM-modified RiPP [Bacteroidales bacterium OttesenSCG-928-M06]|nr:TIGR04149 family rSAM-modified RiPP [Bacteroidales bacterium OttesenSCG-928-M06]